MNRCITHCHPLKEKCEDCPKKVPDFKIPLLLWIIFFIAVTSLVFRVVTKPDYAYNITIDEYREFLISKKK